MPVYKRKYRSGKAVWYYQFAPPGSSRLAQNLITESGFATKQAATDAEAARRIAEQKKIEARKRGAPRVAAALPTTLAMLLAEFMKQHAEEKLAPKTIERYYEMAEYIAPELAAMPLTAITPLHLNREWSRLLASGGHTRKTKEPRAMKPKTVRNIAGLVSSAFVRAIRWGLVTTNPVTNSEPPKVRKRIGMALVTSEQERRSRARLALGASEPSWRCAGGVARGAARCWRCGGRTSRTAARSSTGRSARPGLAWCSRGPRRSARAT